MTADADPKPAPAVSRQEAISILSSDPSAIPSILARAWELRERRFGMRVHLCSIVNAKCGACSEDCAFCAQSVHHNTGIETHPLLSEPELAAARDAAARIAIVRFGIVTSGSALTDSEVDVVGRAVEGASASPVSWCASLGCLSSSQLQRLKKAGLTRYHHNLETARSFFPKVCTTHSYEQRLDTIRAARIAGLEVCSGGILGMGENPEQRVELAMDLAEYEVDSIPLNFLMPVAGTRFADVEPIAALDILKTIAMFRLVNPRAEISVCAGRAHLRSLQALIFYAGASGMMAGPLLTLPGGSADDDLQMIHDLGFVADHGKPAADAR